MSAFTGSYSLAANGRGTLTLNTTSGTFTFVIYPSTGGVLVLETDIRFLTTGAALQQQATAFTAASLQGAYGLNFTGATGSGEMDSIAQFTSDGVSKVSGIIDCEQHGRHHFRTAPFRNFTAAANGRTTMPLQTPLGTQNLVVYLVNGNRALFVELDSGLVAAGDIRHQ